MDVFISWSGKQSQQVADALHRYLPKMINAVEPWLSSADIEAGARWGGDIASKLEKSRVGIICLTPNNLEAVWIHFEAGALAKTLRNTFVCPYLLGIKPSDVKGPLSQFQAIQADQPGTRRLLETLNSALGDNARKTEDLSTAFDMWWPKLREALDDVPEDEAPEERRSDRDILEELLELTRLQARFTLPTALWTEAPSHEILEQVQALVDEALDQIGQSGVVSRYKHGPADLWFQVSLRNGGSFTINITGLPTTDIGRKGLLALMRNKATSKEASISMSEQPDTLTDQ